MLKQPLFRAGIGILAVSLALVFIPFYDRYSLFAAFNTAIFLIGAGVMFAGAVRLDRAEARAEGRKPFL